MPKAHCVFVSLFFAVVVIHPSINLGITTVGMENGAAIFMMIPTVGNIAAAW
jgi:hypothetical protein